MNSNGEFYQSSETKSDPIVTYSSPADYRMSMFLSDESGAALILAAILLPVLLIACALSIDIGSSLTEINSMQQAADNAVRSAAIINSLNGSKDTDVQNEGRALAAANGYVNGVNFVSVNVDPNYNRTGVEVVITKIRNNFLSGIVGRNVTIGARAVSAYTSAPCMIALRNNSTGTTGITFNGTDDASFDCAIYSNSTSTTKSIAVNGGANLAVPYAGMAGCTNASIANMQCNIAPVANPYASVVAQVPSTVPAGTQTITDPSVNCTNSVGCVISKSLLEGKTKINFGIGTYFVTGTQLKTAGGVEFYTNGSTIWFETGISFASSSTITMNNSTLIFPSTSVTNSAGFQAAGSVNVKAMSPPTTGPYAGFSVVDASTPSPPATVGFSGGSADLSNGMGIFVSPNNDLKFAKSTDLSKGCVNLVAATITFEGSTDINSTCIYKNANLAGFKSGQLTE